MNKFVRINIFLVAGVLAVGCAPVPPPQQPVQAVPEEDVQNQRVLTALSDLAEIKQELKQLRNSVEELEFETEYAKRRQRDLFQDIDRRLISLERHAPDPDVQGPLPDNGDGQAVADNPLAPQPGIAPDTSDSDPQEEVVGNGEVAEGTEQDGLPSSVPEVSELAAVTLEEQQAYEAAFELLKQSLYEDAIDQFQQLVDTWPDSQLADDAYYWMSEAMYVIREFEYALSGFRTLVIQYPDSQRVPEALLKVGYIQYDIGAYDDAAETFRDILSRFPGHQVTVSAQTRLRRIEQTIQE